jgi:hypothetical protein
MTQPETMVAEGVDVSAHIQRIAQEQYTKAFQSNGAPAQANRDLKRTGPLSPALSDQENQDPNTMVDPTQY